jgi:hypothetical protein
VPCQERLAVDAAARAHHLWPAHAMLCRCSQASSRGEHVSIILPTKHHASC